MTIRVAIVDDQAQFPASLTGPEQAGEDIFVISQTITTALFHQINEHVMDFQLQLFQARDIFLLLGKKRIKHGFVLPCGVETPLHTQFTDGLDKAETGRDDADGTDNAGGIDRDVVACTGNHVTA